MFRRLLIAFVLLLIVGVVAIDRVGAHVAAHVLAGKLETDEHLDSRPSVSIGGFPFLTQAIGGKYSDVSVTAHDYTTKQGVPILTLNAHLHGVHIPFSKVLHGSVSRVPVDHVDGTLTVTFAGIVSYLSDHGFSLTLSKGAGNSVEVVKKIAFGSHSLFVEGVASISVNADVVKLSVAKVSAGITGKGSPPRAPSGGSFARPFSFSIPLQGLPFRIDVTSIQVTSTGITGTGTANHVVLGS